MKKLLKTGKKTLSVIMAIMMVLTAWVWVAPTEASAAAGKYDVQIKWYVGNDDMDSNGGSISLWTKGNNGTDSDSSATKHNEISFANGDTSGKNQWSDTSMIWTNVGFPYKFTMSLTDTFFGRALSADVYVYVRKNGTTTWSEAVGSFYINDWGDNTTHDGVFTITNAPVATTFNWSNTPEGMTCPKSGSTSQTVAVTANDQFGVQMYDPVWSVKGSACGTSGISVSTGSNKAASTSISLTNGANNTTTTDTQTGTVTATWGDKSDYKTFTITDTQYDISFKYKVQESETVAKDKTDTQKVYYGDSLTVPTLPIISENYSYSDGDYDYKFLKWDPTVETTVTADKSYVAVYDVENKRFVSADYSAVDAITAEIQDEKNSLTLAKFNAKYTLSSLATLETAISNSLLGRPLGRTNQSVVDGYAVAIEEAYRALEPNKYNVIFLDNNGAIIRYDKDVKFETNLTPPDFPEEQKSYHDATNHYTYAGWDTNEFTSVIDDLVISPVYTAEAHDFETEIVSSTCVQAGTTKHTCQTCGYTYYDGGDQLGDHVWEEDFTVDLKPTCVLAGSKSIHCTLCDAQKDVTAIEPKGHNWESYTVAVNPTCENIGISTRVCAEDDCRFCEHLVIDPLGHNYEKTTVAATCTAKGYDEYVCQNDGCGHSYRDNYTDIVAHTYGAWITVSDAHCEIPGVKKQICADCEFVNIGSIPAPGHTEPADFTVVVPATCEGQGYKEKVCSECNVILDSEVIKATGHKYENEGAVVVVDPTCTENGYTKNTCDTCGFITYTDETDAINHEWTSKTHDATCTSGKYIEYFCGNDASHNYIEVINNSQALGHDWDEGTETKATCTNGAYITYTCQREGCKETKVVVPENSVALGHEFKGTETTVAAATCTENGEKTIQCTRCDEKTTVILPRLGHSYGEWDKTTNPATNDKDGTWTRTCTKCGDVETLTIPKGGHTFEEDAAQYVAPKCNVKGQRVYKCTAHADCIASVTVVLDYAQHSITTDNKDASCTEAGYSKTYCSVCKQEFNSYDIPAMSHDFTGAVSDVVDATCTADGSKKVKCTRCDKTTTVAIPKLGHNFDESIEANVTIEKATCESNGSKTVKCSRCDETKVSVLPKLGHKYENEGAVVETRATCTSGAYTTYNCDNCEYSYVVNVQNSTLADHTWKTVEEKAADCENNGFIKSKCSVCNAEKEEVLPRLGHAYGDWEVVKAATNTEDGEWKRVCAHNEKHVETLTIPKGGHIWDDGTVKKAATCTTEGAMVYACNNPAHTNCDITLEVTIPATKHTVAQRESKKATCTTKGEVESYCSICNESFSKYETPVVPHTYAAGQTFAPTCTTSGYTVMVCSCGASYNMYDASKPATGHSYTGSETTAPGCTTEGVKTYTCACGEGSFTDVIPAKGHNFVENTEKATAATCTALATKTFECSCGASYVKHEGALAEHNFDELVKTVPATNDSLGYEERKCDCGLTKITILEATGTHVFTEKIEGECVAPTCTENGTDVYKCTAHEACTAKSSVLVPRLGHTAKAEYTAPTCIAEGSSKAVCETCGDILATEIIPAIPYHNFSGEGEVTLGATCTDEGTMTYTCQTDGCNATKTETIPAKGHKLSVDITEADCETKGKVVISCDNCNDVTIEKTVEFPALGHSWNDGELVDGKDATCTQSAQKLYTCTACNKTKTETIPAKGHSFGAWEQVSGSVNTDGYWKRTCACGETETLTIPRGHNLVKDTVNSKLATCTAEGKEVYICNAHTNCDVKIEVTLPMLQHNYTTEYVDSTCDRSGYIKTSCTVCNKFIVDKIISPKAHKFDGGTKYPATCTDAAYHLYQCINTDAQGNDNCNYSYKAFAGGTDAALGHNLVAGETTATCEGKGSQTFYCNRENCGYATTVEMPARGHDYVLDATTSATCAAPATKTYKCSRCADSYIEYADDKLTEHNAWSVWTVVEATNTSLGYKTRTCNTCGQKEFEIIPATGEHVFDFLVSETKAKCEADGEQIYSCSAHPGETGCKLTSKVTIPATGHTETFAYEAATCSKDGLAKMYCSTCTTVLSEQKIDKLGCNWVQGEVTPSTCNTKGSIAYSCTRCTNTMSAELPTNANAHQYETKVTPATCYSEGSAETKCKLCTNELSVVTLAKLEHTWNDGKATTSATCIAPGVMTYKCTVDGCNAEKTEPIDALGHNWGNWFVEKASTNTAEGTMKRECTVDGCDAYETHTIPAGGHEWDEGKVTKEATCTSTGTKVYACKNHTGDNACGITFTVTLDKLQHKLTTSTTPATCTTDGEVVTKCEKCNTTTITTIIPATGHTYNDGVKTPATCTKTGEILYTCTAKDCGETKKVTLEKLQHVFEAIEEVDATCVKSGYKVYKCKTCTETYNVINGNAKGHNYTVKVSSDASCLEGGKMVLKCADCDATMETSVPALGHDYKLISSTSATCAAAATETYKCSRCEASYTVSTGNKTENHNWTAWNVVVEATYTTLGCESRSCPDCGKVEIKTIEAIGDHTFVDGEIAETKAATCTENGYIIRKCTKHSDCGLTSTEILPATGHNEQTIAAVPATCTTAGSSEGSECTKCGTVLVAPVTLPELGHAWGNEVVTPATCQSEGKIAYTCTRGGCLAAHEVTIPVDGTAHKLETTVNAATCTENGSVTEKCTVDGCSYSKEVVLTAKGHIWNETASSTTPATCENAGSATYKCKYCTAENIVTIPAIGHIYKAGEKVDATCTTSGYTVYTCEHDAKHTYKVYDADATAKPHTWKQTNMEYATCTTNGSVTYKCENCEATKTEIVPAIGHKFNVTEAPATCTQAGTRTYLCTCDATYTELAEPAKGHSFGEWTVVTEATNGTDGQWKRVCANDNNHVEYITIPAGGHNFDTTTADVYDAPSCTEEGSATYYCKAEGHENCGVTVTVTVPATGHNGEIVYNAPSCETPGSSEIYCNTCNKTIAKEEIPALGYHAFSADGVVNEGDEPTCTEEGTITFTCCKDGCDAVKKVKIPAKGHSLNTTVTEATCEAEGSVVTKCTVDGCTYVHESKTLAVKPHSISISNAYPGCEKDGYVKEKCNKCDYERIISTTPALGHSFAGEETVVTPATCLTKGEKTVKCSYCSKTETVEIPALGHNYEAGEEVEATCTASGYIPYTCQNKDCTSSYKELTSNPKGHTWKTQPEAGEIKATCEIDGKATYKCENCEATNVVVTPKFGHSWTNWTVSKEPTATEDGLKTRTCLRGCTESVTIPAFGESASHKVDFVVNGEIIFSQTVNHLGAATAPVIENKAPDAKYHYSALWDTDFSVVTSDLTVTAVFTPVSHSFGDWVVDTEADCKNAGLRHRVCDCGYVQQEVIERKEHTYIVESEKAPTCTEIGVRTLVCSNCGDKTTENIKKLGHEMTYYEGYKATCDTDGLARHYSCSRCGKKFEDRAGKTELSTVVIVKKYHTYVVVEGVAPTCTAEGVTDYRYCTTCGYTQHPETIAATGHADVNNDNTCDKCGATYMNGDTIICSCYCHKNGFFNELIYKILSFFWRLFGSNKSCECGKVHY